MSYSISSTAAATTTTTTAPTFEETEEGEAATATATTTTTTTTRLAQQMLVGGDSYIELSLQPSTADKKQVMVTNGNNLPVEQQTNNKHKPQHQKCSISSSSSMLTNSNSSSSMTSITTSSPTSTSLSNLQHSMRSVSMSLNSSESSSSTMPNAAILANENTSNSATTLPAKFDEVKEISLKAGLEEENVEFEVKIKSQPNDEVNQLLGDRSTSIIESCKKTGTENENKNVVEIETGVVSNEQQQQQRGNAPYSSSIKVSEEEEAPYCPVGEETVFVGIQLEAVEVRENVARRLAEAEAEAEAEAAATGAARLERSNSCSQAETHSGLLLQQTNFIPASISQENLLNNSITNPNTEVVKDKINIVNLSKQLSQPICIRNEPVHVDVKSATFETEAPLKLSSSLERQTTILTSITKVEQEQQQQPKQKEKQQSSSSRFFSSKLNTGSLWSLLSVGSSQSVADEQQAVESTLKDNNKDSGSREEIISKPVTSFFSRVQFKRSGEQQMPSIAYMPTSKNHYEKANKPPEIMTTQDSQPNKNSSSSSSASTTTTTAASSSHLEQRKRLRFNVKYIGSAILHKNFTLPMLEWIAKDVKRQTIRGAQSISQRQFTIPARDILLDIQSNQLTAISCKDGHCIFVHPMHCISKYVQLQFDQTCFSYLIRDTKDSPNFCHVFQAKSANKVHDIFTAIREVTTRSNYCSQQVSSFGAQSQTDQLFAASSQNCVRKSASSDGQHTKLKGFISNVSLNMGQATLPLNSSISDRKTPRQLSLSIPSTPSISGLQQQQQPSSSSSLLPLIYPQKQQQLDYQQKLKQQSSSTNSPSSTMVTPGFDAGTNIIAAATATAATAAATAATTTITTKTTTTTTPSKSTPSHPDQSNLQFENSYQFEVMFVKKVKLQCRRVPASFVDDALETLKSFEVLKSGESKSCQIKGVGKRIINASVDERQEYDEAAYQSSTQKEQTSSHFKLPFERESQSCNQSPSKQRTSSPSSSLKGKLISENNNNPDDDDDDDVDIDVHVDEQRLKGDRQQTATESENHHQSMDSLKNIDCTIKSAKTGNAPNYTNDFSPYNTITSIDLNERIAAIPVVSSSVSLDHETRQKLARQVRETIMATAANIKKDVYASGDKLDSSASSKALDSLSCTVSSQLEPPNSYDGRRTVSPMYVAESSKQRQQQQQQQQQVVSLDDEKNFQSVKTNSNNIEYRRSSANCCLTPISSNQFAATTTSAANNFDLFRRASTRQVVKNRTMLLLIGKDELCTISIDKHQMLFSKSFNSIVHCLQGINNKDHFGLICRDSGKINPNTESYAGFIFKCQSEKVVREIMGALKQVIYSSHHNYHGQNSPYNPLNLANQISKHSSQRNDLSNKSNNLIDHHHHHQNRDSIQQAKTAISTNSNQVVSLAAKRGFLNSLEFKNDTNNNSLLSQQMNQEITANSTATSSTSILNQHSASASIIQNVNPMLSQIATPAISSSPSTTNQQPKNLIKSMFCDNCPLYWFHRLCCDIESLPSEASKAIILRRIDSSMTDNEQDELYSRFSEFNIESIDEHNEIFMSLLRHVCERKQLKHSQSQSHISSLAKTSALTKQQANYGQQQHQQQQVYATVPTTATSVTTTMVSSRIATNEPLTITSQSHSMDQKSTTSTVAMTKSALKNPSKTIRTNTDSTTTESAEATKATKSFENKQNSHHRSGSTSGSLAFVIGQTGANQASQSIADASSVAIDNLKKAKNSISVSIENILKRRSSIRDDNAAEDGNLQIISGGILPSRAGSFKTTTRENRSSGRNCDLEVESNNGTRNNSKNLKRSQSTSDYSNQTNDNNNQPAVISWRDSLSRTINEADLGNNPLVGLFKRRGSTFGSKTGLSGSDQDGSCNLENSENSLESNHGPPCNTRLPSSPTATTGEPRFMYPTNQNTGGASSPSSMLSSAFWKKSIFDKIRQPLLAGDDNEAAVIAENIEASKREEEVAREKLNKLKLDEARKLQQDEEEEIHKRDNNNNDNNQNSSKRTSEELRLLWRKAIVEQITLLKMDKQNQRLQANTVECDIQRIKLNYRDVIYGRDVLSLWDKLLKQDPRQKVEFVEVARLVRLGVPKQRRGEVWMFLMNQYQLRHGTSFQPADSEYHGDANQPYRSLLSQLSTQQHEIFVDIGRTFPTHPYYSQYLSIGQLSLFNLLKAYSLLDQEVGYCQGLSFVAGILLLHVDSEDEAFELMRHLLFNFGLRKQYLPSMNALHLQLYQITRLLRDHEYELFNHFDHYDISPSLYAAPWFLTLFASQFSLGFVARMLDLIFLIGIEAIFRVSLNLLAHHRSSILDCTSLESTMHFMKNNLVNISDKNLVLIFDKSLSLDLRNKLIEYEIEYTFYCAEDRARSGQVGSGQPPAQKPSLLKPGNTLSSEEKDSEENKQSNRPEESVESTSKVADATATIIIQHLLANNHLRSLRSNYSY